jgi:hypothetical protein
MTNGLIAVFVALGATAWIYSKLQHSTGGNTKSSAIGAGIAGAAIFVVVLLLLKLVPK